MVRRGSEMLAYGSVGLSPSCTNMSFGRSNVPLVVEASDSLIASYPSTLPPNHPPTNQTPHRDRFLESAEDVGSHLARSIKELPSTKALDRLLVEGGAKGTLRLQADKPVVLVLGSGWGAHSLMKVLQRLAMGVHVGAWHSACLVHVDAGNSAPSSLPSTAAAGH